MYLILYNPLSAHGRGEQLTQALKEKLKDTDYEMRDIREVGSYAELFASMGAEDRLVISGGDGTLNHFVNAIDGIEPSCEIYYYATGTGNDFYADVAKEPGQLVQINEYIKNLPIVEVNGIRKRFLNGIGYGIDGYCCEVGDELAKKSDKPINYSSIAIKGLLFYYKRTNAKVTVDGKTYPFSKVWLAPAMKGKYYGGGLMIAPDQNRLDEDGYVTAAVMHRSGKLKTLMVFPSIFKGEHVKHKEMVWLMRGHHITVEFDRPTALQIDGETVLGVTTYSVTAGVDAKIAASDEKRKAEPVC